MRYLSLFSGIGGFEVGIQKAHVGWECVGFSEINESAIRVYSEHFPEHRNFGDIRQVQPQKLPKFDVLVGGFPCQSYSTAGKRLGLKDPRGELFFDILRIIHEAKPPVVFLENVKGLTNHDDGVTKWYIEQKLREEGYDVFSGLLNSKRFGVPQNRERVYFVCFRKDLEIQSFSFPKGWARDLSFMDLLEHSPPEEVYLTPKQVVKIKGFGPKNNFGGYLSLSPVYNCLTASYAVDGGNSMKFFRNGRISALSPVECERLQGFPDNWTGTVLTSQRYRTLGNAVTTNVIAELIKSIAHTLEQRMHERIESECEQQHTEHKSRV